MSERSIRIWYQSFVDEPNAGAYWPRLSEHLDAVSAGNATVDVNGMTPHDSYAHALMEWRCGREAICNAVRAEREGYDAIIFGHFQDAGLYEARSAVDIPVVSLGEASMLYCCQLAQRIGIVTINPRFIPWFRHQIRKYGLQDRITGVHSMTFEPGQILSALGSEAGAKDVQRLFVEQAEPLVEQGVELILPGGGIPMLLFSSIHAFSVAGAPVVNGIEIAVKMAEAAVEMRRSSGLAVSRVGEYEKAPPEVIEEFLTHPRSGA